MKEKGRERRREKDGAREGDQREGRERQEDREGEEKEGERKRERDVDSQNPSL